MPFSLDLPRQLSIRIPHSSPPKPQPPASPSVTPHHPMQAWSESPCSSPMSSLSSPGSSSSSSSSSGSSGENRGMCSSSCLSPEALSGVSSASDGVWSCWQDKFYGGREGTEEEEEEEEEERCSTPKSSESRIPETLFCPPAPRKRRAPQGRLRAKRASHVNILIVPDFDAVFPSLRKPPRRIQRHLVQ